MFRALADTTRRRILSALRADELCVGDVARALGVRQPQASRHLSKLRRAGLVELRREGARSIYRMAAPRSALHEHLLACLEVSALPARERGRSGALERARAARGGVRTRAPSDVE